MGPSRIFGFATLLGLASMGALTGCASSGVATVRDLTPRAAARLASVPTSYGMPTSSSLSADEQAELKKVRAAFEAALPAEVRGEVTYDPSLELSASVLAQVYSDELQPPAKSLAQWVVWRSGVAEPIADRDLWWSRSKDAASSEADLDARAAKYASWFRKAWAPRSYAIARFQEGRVRSQAIVVAWRALDPAPFPKAYAAGASFELRAKTNPDFTSALVEFEGDGGKVDSRTVTLAADGSLQATVPLPQKPGHYYVQVSARAANPANPTGEPVRRDLLWVPIYVGESEAATVGALFPQGGGESGSVADRVLAAYDAARARAGLPKLVREADLTRAAEQHAAKVAHENEARIARKDESVRPPDTLGAELAAAHLKDAATYWSTVDADESAVEFAALELAHPRTLRGVLGAKRVGLAASTWHWTPSDYSQPTERNTVVEIWRSR